MLPTQAGAVPKIRIVWSTVSKVKLTSNKMNGCTTSQCFFPRKKVQERIITFVWRFSIKYTNKQSLGRKGVGMTFPHIQSEKALLLVLWYMKTDNIPIEMVMIFNADQFQDLKCQLQFLIDSYFSVIYFVLGCSYVYFTDL